MSGVDYTSPSVHKADLQRIERYAATLATGGSATESGLLWYNLSLSTVLNSGTAAKVLTGVGSPLWSNNWTVDGANNRFTYTGASSKKFLFRFQLSVQNTLSSTTQTYFALYVNGSVSGGNVIRHDIAPNTTQGVSCVNFEFAVPLVNSQYVELWAYASGTNIQLNSTTATFGTSQTIPAIQLVIEEKFIP